MSAGESAHWAPRSSNGAAAARRASWTTGVCPAASRRPAIGVPIRPVTGEAIRWFREAMAGTLASGDHVEVVKLIGYSEGGRS